MLVYNENQKAAFEIFKETCDKSKYLSFDCEMTGLNLETKTDGTKYDTQEFRYYKQRQVVSKLDLIQIGFTFYIEKTKKIIKTEKKDEKNKNEEPEVINKQFYLERTFTFYLFKNSKLKLIDDKIFESELNAHPASLKFLNESNFDFNILIKKGIHYNKLENEEKIREILNKEKIFLSNGAMFLSKKNEEKLIQKIIILADYLVNHNNNEKQFEIEFEDKKLMIFFLGINFKKLLLINDFMIMKSQNKNSLIIHKNSKSISTEKFLSHYTTFDNFKTIIKSKPDIIYLNRYQLGCFKTDEKINELVEDELGFSLYLKYIIDKKIPIIGHNMYFDMMFLYDKLIGDLPPDFYTFKTKIHKYFPYIYDTKYISSSLEKNGKKIFDLTSLEKVYNSIIKNKYDIYVQFFPDTPNGFCLYNDMERDKMHDAGYDSIITGRIFILMNKALEHNFNTSNVGGAKHGIAGEIIKNEQEINLNYGFIDEKRYDNYINKSFMSLVESPNAIILWDVNKQNKENYEKGENQLVKDTFKNVFMVEFENPEDGHMISIYEICNKFENEDYDICAVKSDHSKAFIEIGCEDYCHEKDYPIIKKMVENKKEEKNEELLSIKKVYSYDEFFNGYKDIIKFDY